MPQKPKALPEEKIAAVEAYLRGELGSSEAAQKYRIHKTSWEAWVSAYKTRGPEGLIPQTANKKYGAELKERVVREYLGGNISLRDLCRKYSISRHCIVQTWIKRYNGQKGFKNPNSGSGEQHKCRTCALLHIAKTFMLDNDTPALNAFKALRGAPIIMGRGETPVERLLTAVCFAEKTIFKNF